MRSRSRKSIRRARKVYKRKEKERKERTERKSRKRKDVKDVKDIRDIRENVEENVHFDLFVKAMTGNLYQIDIEPNDTIANIKQKLRDFIPNIQLHRLTLVDVDGNTLENEKTVRQSRITSDNNMVMLFIKEEQGEFHDQKWIKIGDRKWMNPAMKDDRRMRAVQEKYDIFIERLAKAKFEYRHLEDIQRQLKANGLSPLLYVYGRIHKPHGFYALTEFIAVSEDLTLVYEQKLSGSARICINGYKIYVKELDRNKIDLNDFYHDLMRNKTDIYRHFLTQ